MNRKTRLPHRKLSPIPEDALEMPSNKHAGYAIVEIHRVCTNPPICSKEHHDLSNENSAYIYLRSSSYSSACPIFSHGHLGIPKSDRSRAHPEIELAVDWTAFQAATLGTGHKIEDISVQEDAFLLKISQQGSLALALIIQVYLYLHHQRPSHRFLREVQG
jgi:hypothetical protein